MFLWPILQMCLLVIVALIVITQVIVPAFIGKPLFWFFRKPDSELLDAQRELSELDVSKEVQHVNDQIKEKTRNLKRRKH